MSKTKPRKFWCNWMIMSSSLQEAKDGSPKAEWGDLRCYREVLPQEPQSTNEDVLSEAEQKLLLELTMLKLENGKLKESMKEGVPQERICGDCGTGWVGKIEFCPSCGSLCLAGECCQFGNFGDGHTCAKQNAAEPQNSNSELETTKFKAELDDTIAAVSIHADEHSKVRQEIDELKAKLAAQERGIAQHLTTAYLDGHKVGYALGKSRTDDQY